MNASDFDPEFRRTYLGASEAPEALGCSPYAGRSPVRLCLEKQGRTPPLFIGDKPEVQAGKMLEPVIAEWFSRVTKKSTSPMTTLAQSRRVPWMRAHTDFSTGDGALLECKNYGAHKLKDYGESGTDDVPNHDLIQCLHEAECFGADLVYMAILFGGQEFRWYRIETPMEALDALVARETAFWAHVEAGTSPPPTTGADALLLNPVCSPEMKAVATKDIYESVMQLAALKRQEKQLEESIDALKARIQLAMGPAAEMVDPMGRKIASWKNSKSVERLDMDALRVHYPDAVRACTVSAPGSRRFLTHV